MISRRSIERAGVRYLRRGVDVDGNVANFVETEVILTVFGHHLSYIQVKFFHVWYLDFAFRKFQFLFAASSSKVNLHALIFFKC